MSIVIVIYNLLQCILFNFAFRQNEKKKRSASNIHTDVHLQTQDHQVCDLLQKLIRLFQFRDRLCQGCHFIPIWFITFKESISRCSQVVEGKWVGGLTIISLLSAGDLVLLVSSNRDFQLPLG